MSKHTKVYDTYSVFVGHVHPDTTRVQLKEVFQQCGEIRDLVLLESEGGIYKYGFVRYDQLDAAFRAVSELNRWELHGVNLVVDLSKDTSKRVSREKGDKVSLKPNDTTVKKDTKVRSTADAAPKVSRGTHFITDTMYLTRLQESCIAQNIQHSDIGHLDMRRLIDDIGKKPSHKYPLICGALDDPTISFPQVSQKIIQKCMKQRNRDEKFGRAKASEFMSSLETIMMEINKVLESETTEDEGGKEENLENKLFQAVSSEIDDDNKGQLKNGENSINSSENSSGKNSGSGDSIMECLTSSGGGNTRQKGSEKRRDSLDGAGDRKRQPNALERFAAGEFSDCRELDEMVVNEVLARRNVSESEYATSSRGNNKTKADRFIDKHNPIAKTPSSTSRGHIDYLRQGPYDDRDSSASLSDHDGYTPPLSTTSNRSAQCYHDKRSHDIDHYSDDSIVERKLSIACSPQKMVSAKTTDFDPAVLDYEMSRPFALEQHKNGGKSTYTSDGLDKDKYCSQVAQAAARSSHDRNEKNIVQMLHNSVLVNSHEPIKRSTSVGSSASDGSNDGNCLVADSGVESDVQFVNAASAARFEPATMYSTSNMGVDMQPVVGRGRCRIPSTGLSPQLNVQQEHNQQRVSRGRGIMQYLGK